MHHAKTNGFHARHFEAADGHISAFIHMLLQHGLIVHLVNMIAREDDNVFGTVTLDDVDVLINGICRACIPLVFGYALRGWKNIKPFITFCSEEVPAALQMANEAVGFILCCHTDAANARVQRV